MKVVSERKLGCNDRIELVRACSTGGEGRTKGIGWEKECGVEVIVGGLRLGKM